MDDPGDPGVVATDAGEVDVDAEVVELDVLAPPGGLAGPGCGGERPGCVDGQGASRFWNAFGSGREVVKRHVPPVRPRLRP